MVMAPSVIGFGNCQLKTAILKTIGLINIYTKSRITVVSNFEIHSQKLLMIRLALRLNIVSYMQCSFLNQLDMKLNKLG